MIITFVMDQFGETSNGTACTALRFAQILKEKGHEVRVLTASKVDGDGIFTLPEWKLPVFQYIIDRNGIKFAEPDEKIITEAIAGSDIVHMLMPFKLQRVTKEIADKLGVANMAAFHVQPENITYNIKLNKLKPLNVFLYKKFKKFFDGFSHIHCPSEMLREILNKYKYRSAKHVISNGVISDFHGNPQAVRPTEWEGKYVIVMSGRLAREKRQDVLIKAVAKSKYADKIQLVLCGQGHIRRKLEKLGEKLLANPLQIKFCSKEELINIFSSADLYVHASEVELEAISCMEAFFCGLVPVIADAKMSATKQFALSDRNIFRAGDSSDLAAKIDWFIEHPEEKEKMSAEYLEYSKQFRIEACVDKMLEVFQTVIDENERKKQNIKREEEYVASLSGKEKKKYFSEKKKYLAALDRQGKTDYMETFIETVEK
ncbi:glycosyltransferase [Pumilibacter intestinalis]|uniref:glycosyltransferase n=1 Tax=Pumilibacter intestinalis TaxID=2941511 RepID=UPI00203F1ED2|nr:glycosyltransferase [Pumilibacter intestinalis]